MAGVDTTLLALSGIGLKYNKVISIFWWPHAGSLSYAPLCLTHSRTLWCGLLSMLTKLCYCQAEIWIRIMPSKCRGCRGRQCPYRAEERRWFIGIRNHVYWIHWIQQTWDRWCTSFFWQVVHRCRTCALCSSEFRRSRFTLQRFSW